MVDRVKGILVKRISVRLTPEEIARLNTVARVRSKSASDLVREYIGAGLDRDLADGRDISVQEIMDRR